MVCSSCGASLPLSSLSHRNSRLLTGTKLHLCSNCDNMEPRFLIILTARQYGGDSVSNYIRKKLYCGEEILAKELF